MVKTKSMDVSLLDLFLNGFHSELVSEFNEFLNDFSLDIFHELVLNNNVLKLKINYKPNISLPFKTILDEADSYPDGTYDENYVFLYMLIQTLYDNFKFESYEERIKVVCKAFDFDFFPKYGSKLRKQIEIRNAFQHRQGKLDKKSYNSIGSKVEIKQADGTYIEYKPWNVLILTIEEMEEFIVTLKAFCDEFLEAIKNKMQGIIE